tara:strand:- start:1177 stop:1701 length:525 start_codon:yes stop_codon:yes gene_type:complete
MIIFNFIKDYIILFFNHITITKTILIQRKKEILESKFMLFLGKLYMYSKTILQIIFQLIKIIINVVVTYIPLILLFLFNKIFISKKSFKAIAKRKTPNLTLYYPLQSSILSVAIRFMGTILLIILLFCMSFFFLVTVFSIDFKLVILILTVLFYVALASLFYHSINSLTHFLKN